MNVGTFNTAIKFQAPTKTRGEAGGQLETYADFLTGVWSYKKQKNAGENYQGSQLVGEETVEFHTYYLENITNEMVIVDIETGETWQIRGIFKGGFRQKMVILATRKDFE